MKINTEQPGLLLFPTPSMEVHVILQWENINNGILGVRIFTAGTPAIKMLEHNVNREYNMPL